MTLFSHTESRSSNRATVALDGSTRADHDVPAALFGKFGEHLYHPWNVKNVLEAQALYNPTLGSWEFLDRSYDADGGRGGVHDPEEIADRIDDYAEAHDLPGADRLRDAYRDGTALWWFPCGDVDAVRTSPDVGTAGDRAQRVEVDGQADGRGGVAQWCHLPLHRTREFEGTVTLRAVDGADVRLAVHGETGPDGQFGDPIAETTVTATPASRSVTFSLSVPDDAAIDDDALFGFSVTADAGANVVLDRVLLYPDDHVGTADPEVVDLLSETGLPVLRWPGGNFASGYHWRDGVGPVEGRPTRPNPAWDAVETNLFGTDEFVAFCEAVGCEPMICVNAGDGSPEEAARWVEYCNGDVDTPMGRLRAEHGHPEPYDVAYWEVGNEIYGSWQKTWTTPRGNADRFERFEAAMTDVDPSIEVMACGNRLTDWNEPLLERVDDLDWITDHVLVECHADAETDPVELFNAHSGFAAQLGEEYREMASECRDADLGEVPVAITELQLFTRFDEAEDGADGSGGTDEDTDEPLLTRETLPSSHSVTEAVFDATIINQCARDGIVEMVTHSGVGNHGGGIRKTRERSWEDPCLYGLAMGTALIGGTPVGVDVTCGTFSTDTTFGADTLEWFGELRPVDDEPIVDALAVADADDHDVAILLVHRDAGTDPIDVTVEGGDLLSGVNDVTVTTLTADTMYETNTFEEPDRIVPTEERVSVEDDGTVSVTLPPFSVVRIATGEP